MTNNQTVTADSEESAFEENSGVEAEWKEEIAHQRLLRDIEKNAQEYAYNADALGYAITLLQDLGAPSVEVVGATLVAVGRLRFMIEGDGYEKVVSPWLGSEAQVRAWAYERGEYRPAIEHMLVCYIPHRWSGRAREEVMNFRCTVYARSSWRVYQVASEGAVSGEIVCMADIDTEAD